MKLTPEQRVSKARVALMTHPKFCALSGIMLMGKVTVESGWGTACTDGRNEWYDPEFIEQMDDQELCFVIAHENFHKMFQHGTVWRSLFDEDPETAGVACDAVINLMIEDWGKPVGNFERIVKFPTIGGIYDEQYRGMDAGMVYRLLKAQQPPPNRPKPNNGNGNGSGNGKPSTQPPSNPSANTSSPSSFDNHDKIKDNDMTQAEKDQLRSQIDQAIRQGQMLSKDMCKKYGIGQGQSDLGLDELLEPYVDWRQVMRDFVKSTMAGKDLSTYRQPNKRLQHLGIYMPSAYSETTSRIVGATDVSGSVDRDLRNEFFSQLESIRTEVNPEILDVLAWDTEVESHKRFERDAGETMMDVQMRGGGGTDPACVFDYLRKDNCGVPPDAIVVLTDGYVPGWGDPHGINAPVLWVVVGESKAMPTHGQVVYVK